MLKKNEMSRNQIRGLNIKHQIRGEVVENIIIYFIYGGMITFQLLSNSNKNKNMLIYKRLK